MSFPVNGYQGGYATGYEQYPYEQQGSYGYVIPSNMPMDQVMLSRQPKRKSFSILNAAGNLIKGAIINPIKSLFSLGGLASMAIAGGAIAFFGAPAALGLAAVGVGIGGIQLAKGLYNATTNYFSGNMEKAEAAFEDIGGGGITAFLSGRAFSSLASKLNFKLFTESGGIKIPFFENLNLNKTGLLRMFAMAKRNAIGNFNNIRQMDFGQLGSQITRQGEHLMVQAQKGFRDVGRYFNAEEGAKVRLPFFNGVAKSVQSGNAGLYASQANLGAGTDTYDVAL